MCLLTFYTGRLHPKMPELYPKPELPSATQKEAG
jgi:hypothetical protein